MDWRSGCFDSLLLGHSLQCRTISISLFYLLCDLSLMCAPALSKERGGRAASHGPSPSPAHGRIALTRHARARCARIEAQLCARCRVFGWSGSGSSIFNALRPRARMAWLVAQSSSLFSRIVIALVLRKLYCTQPFPLRCCPSLNLVSLLDWPQA